MARLSSDSVSLSNFIDETLPPHNNNLQMEELDSSAESVKIPAIDDGSKKMEFEKNKLVFAKLSGHSDPPWPARVVNISWNNGTSCGYEVFFYGTYQVGKVLANKVWRYNEDSIAKFSKPKIASLRKRNDFFRGLVEIRDCPDIAPSPDVPESASKIPKILIRRTAKEDHLKLQAQSQTNDVNTESLSTYRNRQKVKEGEIGMNWESSSVMTGIKKAGGKHKPSSWILEKSDKRPTQDAFTFEDEDFDERSCISEPSNNTARRPRRTTQPPYWRRLEAKTNEMAAKQISGMRRVSNPEPATRKRENEKGVKSVKSRAKYKKTTPAVSSKIRGSGIADGNEVKMNGQKSDEKETRNTSVVCPPFRRSKNDLDKHSTTVQVYTTTNSYASTMEISPKPQMTSQGTEQRFPDTDTDSTENEEALQNSNPVVRRGLNKANMKPGTKSDITDCVIVKEEPASENPRDWTVAQTVAAIIRMEPDIAPEDIKAIRDHKINGKALLKFNFHELVTYGKMKLGPAKMLSCLVEEWKNKSQQLQ